MRHLNRHRRVVDEPSLRRREPNQLCACVRASGLCGRRRRRRRVWGSNASMPQWHDDGHNCTGHNYIGHGHNYIPAQAWHQRPSPQRCCHPLAPAYSKHVMAQCCTAPRRAAPHRTGACMPCSGCTHLQSFRVLDAIAAIEDFDFERLCVDMCVYMCRGVYEGTCIDMCRDMCMGVCMDMRAGMRMDIEGLNLECRCTRGPCGVAGRGIVTFMSPYSADRWMDDQQLGRLDIAYQKMPRDLINHMHGRGARQCSANRYGKPAEDTGPSVFAQGAKVMPDAGTG